MSAPRRKNQPKPPHEMTGHAMTTEAVCVHHWIIQAATVKDAPGKCKKCGEARTFRGLPDDFKDYYRETGKSLARYASPKVRSIDGWSAEYE